MIVKKQPKVKMPELRSRMLGMDYSSGTQQPRRLQEATALPAPPILSWKWKP